MPLSRKNLPSSKALPRFGASAEDTFLNLLWEMPRLWRAAMDRRLKPLGLSEAKWRTILLMSRYPEMSQVELAQRLGIEAPTVARLLDRLAADGWIERRAAERDRRVKTVHLLPKASGIIKQIDKVIFELRKEGLSELSKAEILACTRTLQKMRANAERNDSSASKTSSGRR
jgi:MarR family transcriptional regulator for hemolysin